RLYAAEKRRAEEQAILLAIVRDLGSTVELGSVLGVIAQRAAQAVGMERCSVFLWREGRLEGVTSQYADGRAASGVWGQVRTRLAADLAELPALTEWLRTAGIVMIDDTASHSAVPRWWIETLRLRSVLIVPLAHQSTAIGLLYFDNTSQAGGITQDQTILATTIASQMALAAENADLYRALRRQLTASEGLVAVARTLAQSLDVQELIRQAMRELTRLLGADTSVFFG